MKKALVTWMVGMAVAAWGQPPVEAPSSPAPSPTPVAAPETLTTWDAIGQLVPNGLKLYRATSEAVALLKGEEIKKSP